MFCVSWGAGTAVLGADDLWLGRCGAADRMLDGAERVMMDRPASAAAAAAHNFAALDAVVDATAAEIVYIGATHRVRAVGRLGSDGGGSLPGRGGTLVARLWPDMVAALPTLPWSETLIVQGDQDWPRAFAVPGAVVIGPAVDLDTAGGGLLYVVHELIHQWLGGLVRKPSDPDEGSVLEAHIDAAAWEFVTARCPAAGPVYDRLYQRYDAIDELRGHAELVRDLRSRLGARVWDGLPDLIRAPDPDRGRACYDASLLTSGRRT